MLHAEGLGRFYEAGGLGSLAPRVRAGAPAHVPHPVLDALEAAGDAGLDVVGMRCASCAWLIEQYLGQRSGVVEVRVSYAASTCHLRWDRDRTSLARLIADLEIIGYRARPANPRLSEMQSDRDGRRLLVRTGVSAFLAMNVMVASIALYAGDFQGIGAVARSTLRLLAAALAVPVVLYGGWPFLAGAVTALRARRATMDTLVALGATTALGVSLYGLVTGGPVYFDTAAMIVALLLAEGSSSTRPGGAAHGRSATCSRSSPPWRGWSLRTAPRRCPSKTSPSARSPRCARASASPPTASSSKAPRAWTKRS